VVHHCLRILDFYQYVKSGNGERIMLSPLMFLVGSALMHMAAAAVVNHNTCDATWSGYLSWDSGSIDVQLSYASTLSIATCNSYDDSYVTIVNANDQEIAAFDDDNCGYYSWGMNEDLLVSLPAGDYEVRVYSFSGYYSDWFSVDVAIVGCGGNVASSSAAVYSLNGDDSEETILGFDHPFEHEIEIVTTDDCTSTWSGRVGGPWAEHGQIGISLTETTTMWLVTCDSEMTSTEIELTQHFDDGSESVIQTFADDSCVSDSDDSSTDYTNQQVSVELSPGHYTAKVSGWSLTGGHATLEVFTDSCVDHWIIAVIIGAVIGSLCFCICVIVGLAYCCGCCCFKGTEAAVKAMQAPAVEGNGSYGQSPGSQVQMLQMQPQYAQVVQQQPQYAQAAQQQPPQYAVQQQQPQFVQPQAAAAAQQLSVPQQPALVQQCVYTSD